MAADINPGDRVFVRLRPDSKSLKAAMYNGGRGTVISVDRSATSDYSVYIVRMDKPIGFLNDRFEREEIEKLTVLDLLSEIE